MDIIEIRECMQPNSSLVLSTYACIKTKSIGIQCFQCWESWDYHNTQVDSTNHPHVMASNLCYKNQTKVYIPITVLTNVIGLWLVECV